MTDDAREAGWRESGPVLVQAAGFLREYGKGEAPRDPSPHISAYAEWLAYELEQIQAGLEQAQEIVDEHVELEETKAYPLRAFSVTVEIGAYRVDVEGDTWEETAALVQATLGTIQPEPLEPDPGVGAVFDD